MKWKSRKKILENPESFADTCIYILTDIRWEFNFFVHNNRIVAERLRWWTYKLVSLPYEGSNPTIKKIRFFCNVHLFRVPRSWTGSAPMKSA